MGLCIVVSVLFDFETQICAKGRQVSEPSHPIQLTKFSSTHTMSNQNNKLLLLKGIALIYRESCLADGTNSKDILKRIIKDSATADMIVGRSVEAEVTNALKNIAKHMADNASNHVYDANTLKTEVRLACSSDETIAAIVDSYFDEITESDQLKLTVLNLRKSIKKHFSDKDLGSALSKASIKFATDRDSIDDTKSFVTDLVAKLEPYTVSGDEKDPAINTMLSLSDDAAVLDLVERVQRQEDGTHILQTGWQCINRMLDGGFRPGEQWVIPALEHKWKTGFSKSLLRQFAQYNDSVSIRDISKKPCLVHMSFEDSIESSFQFLYKSLWENESGNVLIELPDDPVEIANYVKDKMTARGWELFMYDVNPSQWTYMDICNEILRLEARGYEVRVLMLDYLLKLPTTGCLQGPHGVDIRNLFERVKAFTAPRKITMITPHQLGPSANNVLREFSTGFVKEVNGGHHYAGTSQLGQVIDGELYIHIEYDGKGRAYLTIQRGKHRKIGQTPIEYLYAALMFMAGGVVLDDVDKFDTTRLKIGGPTLGSIGADASQEIMF